MQMSPRPCICHCRKVIADNFCFAVTVYLFLAAFGASAQMIDLNGNGISDIWEWTYNVYGINPNIDSDGDGFLNWQEAISGTDPLNPKSYLSIPTVAYTRTNFSMTMPGYPGKQYTLMSFTNPASVTW